MITLKDYWMGRDAQFPPTNDQVNLATELLDRINRLGEMYGHALRLTSGYRPPEINATIAHAAHGDAHERCQGIDLADPDGDLSKWCVGNQEFLERVGLWMEAPQSAVDHVHLQSYAPHSGNRIFIA